jgi:predicted nucleic acid-binding protein
MNVYVTDANIFIDLLYAGLLNLMPRLGFSIVTTQLVADELNAEQQVHLQSLIDENAIEIREISLLEITDLPLPKGLSLPDRSVLCLAVRENGVLISGDGLVRRTAGNLGIDVRGLLWLFDEFMSLNLVSPLEAAEKLEFLVVEKGSRQPDLEYNARLERWRNG